MDMKSKITKKLMEWLNFNVLKRNESRIIKVANQITQLDTAFKTIQDDITKDLETTENTTFKTVSSIDKKIEELQIAKCKILDEKEKVVKELSEKRNKIIVLSENMFKNN